MTKAKAVRRRPKIDKKVATERARAREIVDLCRRAIAEGGTLVLNPEDSIDEQTTFRPDMAFLLGVLSSFADHGTFHPDPHAVVWRFMLNHRVKAAVGRSKSRRGEDKVNAVIDEFGVEDMTARRLIKGAGA